MTGGTRARPARCSRPRPVALPARARMRHRRLCCKPCPRSTPPQPRGRHLLEWNRRLPAPQHVGTQGGGTHARGLVGVAPRQHLSEPGAARPGAPSGDVARPPRPLWPSALPAAAFAMKRCAASASPGERRCTCCNRLWRPLAPLSAAPVMPPPADPVFPVRRRGHDCAALARRAGRQPGQPGRQRHRRRGLRGRAAGAHGGERGGDSRRRGLTRGLLRAVPAARLGRCRRRLPCGQCHRLQRLELVWRGRRLPLQRRVAGHRRQPDGAAGAGAV